MSAWVFASPWASCTPGYLNRSNKSRRFLKISGKTKTQMSNSWQLRLFRNLIDDTLNIKWQLTKLSILTVMIDYLPIHHFLLPFFAFFAYACFSAAKLGFFSAYSNIYLNCLITSASIPSTLSLFIYSFMFLSYSISHPAIRLLIFSVKLPIIIFFLTISATSAKYALCPFIYLYSAMCFLRSG